MRAILHMISEKNKARKKVLSGLAKLDEKDIKKHSAAIYQDILKKDFLKGKKNIHCYASFGWEIDTCMLLLEIIKRNGFALVPFIEENKIFHAKVYDIKDLRIGKYHIYEPIDKKRYLGKCDMFFVPGVAFDNKGNRLGRGKGFYDSFLSHKEGIRIGLANDCQLLDAAPNESKDIKMDYIFTENKFIVCKDG
jgi:5-formyltetrahydrofolate cyclo-ligase